MIREFFLHENLWQRAFAWIGAAWMVALAYAGTRMTLFYNTWLGGWFSFAQHEVGMLLTADNATLSSAAQSIREAAMDHVDQLILDYLIICTRFVIFSAVSNFAISHFGMAWRMSLIDSYLARWEAMPPTQATIEGASQRIQEDTQRFTVGIERGAVMAFEAIFKVAVFGPRVVQLGSKIAPPRVFLDLYAASGFYSRVHDGIEVPAAGTHYPAGWMLHFLVVSAILGFGVALLATRHLIAIEVNNQKIEAAFRKQLVYAEAFTEDFNSSTTDDDGPDVPVTPPMTDAVGASGTQAVAAPVSKEDAMLVRASRGPSAYESKLCTLRRNYGKLYCNFLSFEFWTFLFSEVITLAPFFFAGHKVFDATDPIDVGILIQISNASNQIYESLGIATRHWASINEYRSVERRLREFEERLPDIGAVGVSKGDRSRSEADLL